MSHTVYVVRNQHGLYWGKSKEWVPGVENQPVFRCKYHDEALNLVFELSSKDIELRAEALACETDHKGHPIVEPASEEAIARYCTPPQDAAPTPGADAESASGAAPASEAQTDAGTAPETSEQPA